MKMHKNKSGVMSFQLSKKRKGFLNWSAMFFLLLGSAAVAKFFFDGRSFLGEWNLLASQLAVTLIIALPVGFFISGLSKGCIVCRDENVETEE